MNLLYRLLTATICLSTIFSCNNKPQKTEKEYYEEDKAAIEKAPTVVYANKKYKALLKSLENKELYEKTNDAKYKTLQNLYEDSIKIWTDSLAKARGAQVDSLLKAD